MKTFKLVNPLIIFDKFNGQSKSKDVYKAIDNIYINYTNFFTKLYTPITFMTLKDNYNKLYHFQINEKSKGDITYKIKKVDNDKKKDVQFNKILKNIDNDNINGGKYYDSDFDSDSDYESSRSSSSSSDDYKKKKNKKSRSSSSSSDDYKKKKNKKSRSSSSSSDDYKKKKNKKYSTDSSESLNSSSSSISLDMKYDTKNILYYYCPDLYDNNYLYMPTVYYIPDNKMYINDNNKILIDALLQPSYIYINLPKL